jgi:hypothetical protein
MPMLSTNNNKTDASHPFSWEIPVEFAQMEIDFSKKKLRILTKSEFFCPSGQGIYKI